MSSFHDSQQTAADLHDSQHPVSDFHDLQLSIDNCGELPKTVATPCCNDYDITKFNSNRKNQNSHGDNYNDDDCYIQVITGNEQFLIVTAENGYMQFKENVGVDDYHQLTAIMMT